MRPTWLLLLLVAGCTVRVPRPGELVIPIKVTTRVEARVEAPVVKTVVAIENSPVVEFFGIPLEGSQDVVFVLDCSGSMAELAQGRLSTIQVAPPPSAPPVDAPVDAGPGAGAPPPPPSQAPTEPPVDAGSAAAAAPPAAPAPPRKIDVAQFELVDALSRLPAGTTMNVLFFNNEVEGYAASMVQLDEANRASLTEFVKEIVPSGATALTPAMRVAFLMNARRIVLLSDGLGNRGGSADVLLRDAREAIRGGVRIDPIGLGRDQDASLLGTLASESGGLYQPL